MCDADGPSAESVSRPLAADGEAIRVRGARVHNLRDVDVDIPRDRLVVITGVSGSGKSSLAFDTLFAEGQRQYLESLSVYARQFLHQLERPDVDLIDGLQPTISIDQRSGSSNPRSTVATITELYDYLRLLMARLGEPRCPQCSLVIRQENAEDIRDRLLAMPSGTKVMLLAPVVRGQKGPQPEAFTAIRKAGFLRARVDGEIVDVEQPGELSPRKPHFIEAVVDRIVVREGIADRLGESVNLAVKIGGGGLIVCWFERKDENSSEGTWHEELHSTVFACPNCQITFEELEPRTFSFNSPYGACPDCEGLGRRVEFDAELVINDPSLSLAQGVVAPWKGASPAAEKKHAAAVTAFVKASGVSVDAPFAEWPAAARDLFFHGNGKFAGLLTLLEQEFATATKPTDLQQLELFRGEVTCRSCGGSRLRPEARNVLLQGKAIHEITALTIGAAAEYFKKLKFLRDEQPVAKPIVAEIVKRLSFLRKVGVDYLSLDRPADTLSGGELQRVRLAGGIGSGLVGACYILDEPSIGLHPRDNERLIEALRDLQKLGNTVLVVEHDEAMMQAADHLIDIGPGAGQHGGQIVAAGTPHEVQTNPHSLTGQYLSGEVRIDVPTQRRKLAKTRSLILEGVTTNNLRNVTARFPLSALVCVTGVSGSGKSSLMNETLARAIHRRLLGSGPKPGPHTSLRGVSQIDRLVMVDQAPIGRTPRSNPATFTGVYDEIRKVFAGTKQAKQLGFKVNRFSFNVKGGRCETCQGNGQRKLEMNFLPDLYVQCPDCAGQRFNEQTLQVRYKEKNIAETLAMRVDDAAAFFENVPNIHRLLTSLQQVGLGYLTLGQSAMTLSGGEAQRIKLAAELARVDTGQTLYLLDEPTTGLHFHDVRKLLEVLQRLVDLGNTVIVIEHNLDMIKAADWLIDLGPEGGEGGGHIVAEGTPEEIAALPNSHTGRFLTGLLRDR